MTVAKFFVVLRIRLSKQIKKVRVSFWKYTKYRVIVVPKANFDKAKKEPLFVTAIQLGRLVNSLTVLDWGRFTDTKDRIEQLFLWSSLLYEAIKEFFRRECDLKSMKSWQQQIALIESLKKERDGRGSPWWQVILDIRNDVMFHFLKIPTQGAADLETQGEEVIFTLSRTQQSKDMVFSLGDDLLLNYVFKRDWMKGSVAERIESLTNYVLKTTESLITCVNSFVFEFLYPIASLKRMPLP